MHGLLKSTLEMIIPGPVLIDVGASAGVPDIWKNIARQSTYVGFDPDTREFDVSGGTCFGREVRVAAAVVPQAACAEVPFYLTRSPFCSSMLEPDRDSLQEYAFAELFDVERQVTVKSISLGEVAAKYALKTFDWVKFDSQGMDLRLFRSIPRTISDRVLAVDVEPGLAPAYHGEDYFTDAHTYLLSQGFWLSRLDVLGSARISRGSADEVIRRQGRPRAFAFLSGLRDSPYWCEARYLRTTEWVRDHGGGSRDLLLLWVFAIMDGQYGFAMDVGRMYGRLYDQGQGEAICRSAFRRTFNPFLSGRWKVALWMKAWRDYLTKWKSRNESSQ